MGYLFSYKAEGHLRPTIMLPTIATYEPGQHDSVMSNGDWYIVSSYSIFFKSLCMIYSINADTLQLYHS